MSRWMEKDSLYEEKETPRRTQTDVRLKKEIKNIVATKNLIAAYTRSKKVNSDGKSILTARDWKTKTLA